VREGALAALARAEQYTAGKERRRKQRRSACNRSR
jgi:hypothetical protein